MSVRVDDTDFILFALWFQYNDCVGSSLRVSISINPLSNFNTTIVSVRGTIQSLNNFNTNLFQYNDCVGSSVSSFFLKIIIDISIQRLCRFECLYEGHSHKILLFQYNDCVGSRKKTFFGTYGLEISIQRLCRFETILLLLVVLIQNFNTTIVSVRVSPMAT